MAQLYRTDSRMLNVTPENHDWAESVIADTSDATYRPDATTERETRPTVDARSGHLVPAHAYAGLVAYRDEHLPVGDFLHAVLTNDLEEAVCRADDMNLPVLGSTVNWIHDNMPVAAYGLSKRVAAWRLSKPLKETGHGA